MVENIDYVVCQICNKQMKQITYKHLKHHNITSKEYQELYPNSLIRCIKSKNEHLKHQNNTNLERYGCKRPLQNKDIKNKADETLFNNYGVYNGFNVEGSNEKSKATQLKLYGAETPFNKNSSLRSKLDKAAQSIESKEKRVNSFKLTCLKKYGVDHTWKVKSIRSKCTDTIENIYGYRSVFSNSNIQIKAHKYECGPNKPEKIILDIIGDNGWYSGNGNYWIHFNNNSNKNPDFKIHGKNKVIECYGDYWHRNDKPEDIVKLYNEVGYECLVIWEHELKNIDKVKSIINSFIIN